MGLNENTQEYKIPSKLASSRDVIVQQLKLLEKLFPKRDENRKKQENGKDSSKELATTSAEKRSKSPQPSTSRKETTAVDNSNLAKKQKITKNIKDYIPVVVEKGQMAKKLEAAAPYNFFLTAITDSKLTHHEPLTITMQGKTV